MLTPKKVIPSLAVAMLALTGTGCSDDAGGTGGGGGSGATGGSGGGLADALSAFCMKIAECYAEYTEQDCLNYYDGLFEGIDLTSSCQAAFASYLDCGAALSCEELAMENNSCDDEYYAIFDDCMLVQP